MTADEIDPILKQCFADRRISSGEKTSLSALLDESVRDENARAFVRHRAFAVAKDEMLAADPKQVVDCLDDLLKVIEKKEPGVQQIARPRAFFSPSLECLDEIIAQFNTARLRVDVCVFTITDDRISRAILNCHKRGAKVRIITDNDKANDLGSDIQEFRAAGIPVLMDNTPAHMHHKFAIFDNIRLLSGSYNWTRSAAEINRENFIVTEDRSLVADFTRHFEFLWRELENS